MVDEFTAQPAVRLVPFLSLKAGHISQCRLAKVASVPLLCLLLCHLQPMFVADALAIGFRL